MMLRDLIGEHKTMTAEHYMGMSGEDQLIVDTFLDAMGVLPIQCVAIHVELHPNWDQLGEGDVDPVVVHGGLHGR